MATNPSFVATKVRLSRQNYCRGRHTLVVTADVFCHDKHTFVASASKFIVQELCESRGGRPGLSVLTSLLVSVDVNASALVTTCP